MVLAESSQDSVPVMMVKVLTFGENEAVIHVNDGELLEHVPKDVIFDILKDRGGITPPRQHDQDYNMKSVPLTAC